MNDRGVLLETDGLPTWLDPVLRMAASATTSDLTRFAPPAEGGRQSAVLILLGAETDDEPYVVVIERAHDMNSHAGQPAFPGGAFEPDDDGPVGTALRESVEEIGLEPEGVVPFAILPDLFLPPSGFVVTPVLAWWKSPSPIGAVDPREVASVHLVPISELTDPARRVRAQHPSGFVGPAFDVRGLLIWGFTGGLLDRILELSGWALPWEPSTVVEVSS